MSQTFPRVWRELEELEKAEAAHGSTYSKVRFECNDAVAQIGRVELTGFFLQEVVSPRVFKQPT